MCIRDRYKSDDPGENRSRAGNVAARHGSHYTTTAPKYATTVMNIKVTKWIFGNIYIYPNTIENLVIKRQMQIKAIQNELFEITYLLK